MTPEQIKEYRLSRGWSQERLARELGVGWGSVQRWESGKSKPTQWVAMRLEALISPDQPERQEDS